jgi:hypothetical protein
MVAQIGWEAPVLNETDSSIMLELKIEQTNTLNKLAPQKQQNYIPWTD